MTNTQDEKIREYWEDPNTRSLIDNNLRMIEEQSVTRHIQPNDTVLDIGCGDGQSTVQYAAHAKRCMGIERSLHLLGIAKERAAALDNLEVEEGHIMDLERFRDSINVAVTQRVLINLLTWEDQAEAIRKVRSTLKYGGLYVMIENTNQGHQAVNAARAAMGLKEIAQHWHNLYFDHDQLIEYMASGFTLVAHHTFDLYYLLTRVYVNTFADFKGFGANAIRDDIFEVSDEAARRLFENFGSQFRLTPPYSFGPIQAFVWRKVGE